MSLLPSYLDTRDPEAVRGTNRLRSIDPNLIVGLDTRRHVYQVYGPSVAFRGWVAICDCQDDLGRPFRGIVPWELILAALVVARDGELSADRAARENERLQRERYEAEDRRIEEGAKYFARGVAGEREGWGRWDADDIAQGWQERWT